MDYYHTKRWKKLRESALRRDGYMSQISLRYGKRVQADTVHHIFPRTEYPEYQWELWNLMSMTSKEHDELHDRNTGELTDEGKNILLRTAQKKNIDVSF